MKLKILTPVMVNHEVIKDGIHDFDKETTETLLKNGWARPVAKDENPNQVDIVEDLPLRLQDEIDDGALKGLIVDPSHAEQIPVSKKKKNK
jgi:hypothetical protein